MTTTEIVITALAWAAALLVILAIAIGGENEKQTAITNAAHRAADEDEAELPYRAVDHGVLVDIDRLDEFRGVWAMENGAPE